MVTDNQSVMPMSMIQDTLIVGCVPMNFFGGGEVDPVTSQPVTVYHNDPGYD